MKIQTILVLISIVVSLGFNKICAQEKITFETTRLPSDFEFDGHDAEVLFKNINTLLKQNKAKGKKTLDVSQILKGKPVYKNLTTDDLFAFILRPTKSVFGRKENPKLYYSAKIFPLIKMDDFPPPQPEYLPSGSFEIAPTPLVTSPNNLVSEFVADEPLETFWTSRYLPIKTVYPPQANAKKYVGRKAVCVPYSPNVTTCDGEDFIVRSPQIHYGISFVKQEAFPLVKVSNKVLSLKTYDFEYQEGAGLAAWNGRGEKDNENNVPIFIVKLVAPYIESKSFQTPDSVERKPHQAVRNILYVDLAAIWIYDARTGLIISKSGEKPTD